MFSNLITIYPSCDDGLILQPILPCKDHRSQLFFNHTQNATVSSLSCYCKRWRGSREVGAGIFGRAPCTLFAVSLSSSISASREYLHRKQCVKQILGVTSRQHHGDKPPQETNHLWYLVSCNLHTCAENGREKHVVLTGGKKLMLFSRFAVVHVLSCFLQLYWHSMACFLSPFEQQEILHCTHNMNALKFIYFSPVLHKFFPLLVFS